MSRVEPTEKELRLAELVRQSSRGDKPQFKPFVAYDGQGGLDRISFIIGDCSFCEDSIDGILVIMEDNNSEDGEDKYVGFAIEAARSFCKQADLLSDDGTVDLYEVLNVLWFRLPHLSPHIEIARNIMDRFSPVRISLAKANAVTVTKRRST